MTLNKALKNSIIIELDIGCWTHNLKIILPVDVLGNWNKLFALDKKLLIGFNVNAFLELAGEEGVILIDDCNGLVSLHKEKLSVILRYSVFIYCTSELLGVNLAKNIKHTF